MSQAMTDRIRELLQPEKVRKAAVYAENRLRCASAVQVAALCGKFVGTFYCDDRGFRPAASADGGAVKPAVMSNNAKYQMQRCALQAGT